MSILASGGARARRLSTLLASTALVSVAALSMAVTGASAACTTLFTGVVDCLANTTTTNSTNTNGATNPSSDRVQEFNNSANITPTIAATVDGYGLQFLLTNAGSNSIGVINSGTVTTNQNVNALELNGNGALVGYIGTGTVSTTAGGGNAMAVTNIGAGGVTVINSGVFSSVSNYGLSIDTTGGSTGAITVTGTGTISRRLRRHLRSGRRCRHRRYHQRRSYLWRQHPQRHRHPDLLGRGQRARCLREHRLRLRRHHCKHQRHRHNDGHHRRCDHRHLRCRYQHRRG